MRVLSASERVEQVANDAEKYGALRRERNGSRARASALRAKRLIPDLAGPENGTCGLLGPLRRHATVSAKRVLLKSILS
jgi:hypothetical protein